MHSYENEAIVVQREVKAVAIPAGVEVNLKLGSVGYITASCRSCRIPNLRHSLLRLKLG